MNKIIMSVDVEDWFTSETLSGHIDKNNIEYRVENNVNNILGLFEEKNAKGTFFVVGDIAKKFPKLVELIYNNGHEIASHGYSHTMLTKLKPSEIYNELYDSKNILEDIIQDKVLGFRAPVFSITDDILYMLNEIGYKYDSSLNNSNLNSNYGKIKDDVFKEIDIYKLIHDSGLIEVPIRTVDLGIMNVPWSGGYFRLLPYDIHSYGLKKHFSQFDTFLFYTHPWEIDTGQPRIKSLSKFSYFRQYYGLTKVLGKLSKLTSKYETITIQQYLCI